ncbi:hypothetical protein M2368_002471 [Arthrobacter sp. JUb119]|uniref:VOC family protein n=1 Tax=Micrococcaceae TaxID=1268 RepID=UPI000CFDC1D2|nr:MULTISPECIES: VOC family protein [unclassified Arthrobacter]MCS3493459.1 hypothetical protein [Arthrobacter sp. JUb119]PQZ83714.1 glyoxalase [Arthrobacter sp. MYb222]PRB74584.1 glyoxalase [Arthrobacter sp. MYb214]
MASVLSEIAVDCANPMLVARFWCEALNYDVLEEEAGLVSIGSKSQGPGGLKLTFAQVPETKSIKNRLHLDLRPQNAQQQEEADRLISLGASYADVGQREDESWIVMADPEGNEFCVLSGVE